MPMYDRKGYKNPRIPRGNEVVGAGKRESAAPPRAGGMLQMAAQARARQPKAGAPPIPESRAFRPDQKPSGAPPSAARPKVAARPQDTGPQLPSAQGGGYGPVNVFYGAAPSAMDPRQQAAMQIAGGGGTQYPTIPKPQDEETQLLEAKSGPAGGPSPGETPPAAADPDKQPPPEGWVAGWGEDIEPDEPPSAIDPDALPFGYVEEDIEAADQPTAAEYKEQKEKEKIEGYAEAQEKAAQDQFAKDQAEKAAADQDKGTWSQDEEGNWIYTPGVPGVDAETVGGIADTKVTQPPATKGTLSQQIESNLMDYLNQATGIPEEQLQGQIAQLHMASGDQMVKMAQQMAARGVGASGLTGQGMGQIASQTVAAVANLRFENAKMAIEEKLNKYKAFMAFRGQAMSEENRMKIFNEMNDLEKQKFNYEKEQNALADQWTKLNNLAALGQGWDNQALQFAFKALSENTYDEDGDGVADRPMTADEVMNNLYYDDKTGKLFVNAKGKAYLPEEYGGEGKPLPPGAAGSKAYGAGAKQSGDEPLKDEAQNINSGYFGDNAADTTYKDMPEEDGNEWGEQAASDALDGWSAQSKADLKSGHLLLEFINAVKSGVDGYHELGAIPTPTEGWDWSDQDWVNWATAYLKSKYGEGWEAA